MTTDELISYYSALLIAQYATRPKAIGTVKAAVGAVVADSIVRQVFDGFDVASAVGMQLDILGKLRGITRLITGLDLGRTYFAMPSVDDGSPGSYKGFASVDDPFGNVNWFFLMCQDTNRPTYAMNDDELRRLIQLRAAFQHSSLGVGEIDAILLAFFGPNVLLHDNFDMTMNYQKLIADNDTLFVIAASTGTFPKPAGVAMTTTAP